MSSERDINAAAAAVVGRDTRFCEWHGAGSLNLPVTSWRTLLEWTGELEFTVLQFCSPHCVASYLEAKGTHTVTRDERAPGGFAPGHEPKVSAPAVRGTRSRGRRRS